MGNSALIQTNKILTKGLGKTVTVSLDPIRSSSLMSAEGGSRMKESSPECSEKGSGTDIILNSGVDF